MSANKENKSELKTSLNHYFFLRKGWPWTIILKPLLMWRRAGVLAQLAESHRALRGACSSLRVHKARSASLTHPLFYLPLPHYVTCWHVQFEPSCTLTAGYAPLDLFLWGLSTSLHHVWMALPLQGWSWLHHPCRPCLAASSLVTANRAVQEPCSAFLL